MIDTKLFRQILIIVVLLSLGLVAACSSADPTPKPVPTATATPLPTATLVPTATPVPVDDVELLSQFYESFMELAVARDHRALYDMCSPEQRARVSFKDFDKLMGDLADRIPPEGIELRDINLDITGNTAVADYDVYNNGELLTHYTSGELIKLAGEWKWNSETDC